MLFPGRIDGYGDYVYTELLQAGDITLAPTAILSTEPLMEEPWYSCFPQRLQAIENSAAETNEVIVPFGIYELRIQNGHKRLRLR